MLIKRHLVIIWTGVDFISGQHVHVNPCGSQRQEPSARLLNCRPSRKRQVLLKPKRKFYLLHTGRSNLKCQKVNRFNGRFSLHIFLGVGLISLNKIKQCVKIGKLNADMIFLLLQSKICLNFSRKLPTEKKFKKILLWRTWKIICTFNLSIF